MCIFSGAVEKVCSTQIFGRLTEDGTQYLVYQMEFSSTDEVAMILPVPAKDTVQFLNLEKCPDFFTKIEALFPQRQTRSMYLGVSSKSLAVFSVGDFEASFVPGIRDFGRLDKRFQFAPGTLDTMTQLYADFGFAVFKLKPTGKRKTTKPHPMAFKFKTQDPERIFFPTVHVHDGEWHEHESFDHALYAQVPSRNTPMEIRNTGLNNSAAVSSAPLLPKLFQGAAGEVVAKNVVFKTKLQGQYPNKDQYFELDWEPGHLRENA